MDFRDFAAKETSALIEKLLAGQSDAALQQIHHLRDALDEAARAAEASAAASAQVTEDVQELVKRLNNAASTAVRTVSQRIREEARVALEATQADLEAQRAEAERLSVALAGAEAQVEVLRDEVRHERERADGIDRDLILSREAYEQLERESREALDALRLDLEATIRQHSDARTAVEDELREVRGLLDASLFEAARAAEQLEAETTEKLTLQRELAAAQSAREGADAARLDAEAAYRVECDARGGLENDLRETRDLLDSTIAENARLAAQVESLTAQVETELAEAATLRSELAAARVANEELEASRAAADARASDAAHAQAALEGELQDVRMTLEAALAETSELSAQIEASSAEQNRLLAELSSVQGELDTALTQRDAVASQLKNSSARVHTLERNQARHEEAVRQLEARLQEAAAGRDQAAGDARDGDAARAEAAVLRTEVDRLGALLASSIHAFDDLARASSLSDLLGGLVRQLSSEFSRVALFRVKGNRLEGEHQSGFDHTTDVSKLVIPLSVESLLTRAATSGVVERLTDSDKEDGGVALFGSKPDSALALPIMLHGEPLAIVYVEHATRPDSDPAYGPDSASTAYARLLVGHTVALLTRLTKELKTLAELREYATILLQEAQQMFAADADAGKSGEELRLRLRDNIDCARQLYAQRAALEGAAATTLLDEQISALLHDHADTPFARELAALAGHPAERRAAEAS
jgi:hypothetical protein